MLETFSACGWNISPGGGDICCKFLALTQGFQQAFVRAVFANAPGCPGVAPPPRDGR